MKTKTMIVALAACAVMPAFAQSAYTPSDREAQQARANTARDMKLANEMEKARLKEEARPVSAYIPKEQPQQEIKEHRPEVFTAGVPGSKKKKAEKKAERKKA